MLVHIANIKVTMLTKSWIIYSVGFMMLLLETKADVMNPPACEIFCRGKILEVVQNSRVFTNDKEFVDMSIRLPIEQIYSMFDTMMNDTNGKPHKVHVRRFVRKCFFSPGREIQQQSPIDWVKNPAFLNNIKDSHFRKWAEHIVVLWKRYARKVSTAVRDHPDNYSMVYVPNIIMVSGGKYREYYYWNSYWIILGLLRSEMYQTVKGMITNYLILVETYGYVPNSGRIYSLTRSNMPLLLPMVKEYYKVTNDIAFLKKNIDILEKEMAYWLKNRVLKITTRNIERFAAMYFADANEPRPEAYRNDVEAARSIRSPEGKSEFFKKVIAACESGWEFSSRWFENVDIRKGKFTDTNPSKVVPVDLNAVICWSARILQEFYTILEIRNKASFYSNVSATFQATLDDLLWNETDGIWYDMDLKTYSNRRYYFASNVAPLWTGCYDTRRKNHYGFKVAKYLERKKIDSFKGGAPTSLIKTNLHWDYPYATAPMQHLIITGLRETRNKDANHLAFKLANNWLYSTYSSYVFTNTMFDRYNVEHAYGGSRTSTTDPVAINGWTNGVCLELLHIYGKTITLSESNGTNRHFLSPSLFSTILISSIIVRGTNM